MSRNFGIRPTTAANHADRKFGQKAPSRTLRAWALLSVAIAVATLVAVIAVAVATEAWSQSSAAAQAQGTTPPNRGSEGSRPDPSEGRLAAAAACEAARDASAVAAAVSREYANATDDTALALRVMALTIQVEWEKRRDERCGAGAK